jgi:hypothetical protein
VKSRLDLAISDLGETKLKNIAEPIRVYSLQLGNAIAKAAASVELRPRLRPHYHFPKSHQLQSCRFRI